MAKYSGFLGLFTKERNAVDPGSEIAAIQLSYSKMSEATELEDDWKEKSSKLAKKGGKDYKVSAFP